MTVLPALLTLYKAISQVDMVNDLLPRDVGKDGGGWLRGSCLQEKIGCSGLLLQTNRKMKV